jgi:hypothetical protein
MASSAPAGAIAWRREEQCGSSAPRLPLVVLCEREPRISRGPLIARSGSRYCSLARRCGRTDRGALV